MAIRVTHKTKQKTRKTALTKCCLRLDHAALELCSVTDLSWFQKTSSKSNLFGMQFYYIQ